MDVADFLTEDELATLLRTDHTSFWRWRRKGVLQSVRARRREGGHEGHTYPYALLDGFFAAQWVRPNPKFSIRVADLIDYEDQTGEPALLTIEEACEKLRVSRTALVGVINSGDLPAIKIVSTIRIPFSALEYYRKAVDVKGVINVRELEEIVGAGKYGLSPLVGTTLVRAGIPRQGRYTFVTEASANALIGSLLSRGTPEEWRAVRRQHPGPLLTKREIIDRFHVSYPFVAEALDDGDLLYINSVNSVEGYKIRRVPEPIVKVWLASERTPLTPQMVAHTLGISVREAEEWMAAGHFRLHKNRGRTALRIYITSHLVSDHVTAAQWVRGCLDHGMGPRSALDVIAAADSNLTEFRDCATEARLQGVWYPDHSNAALSPQSAAAFRRYIGRLKWERS